MTPTFLKYALIAAVALAALGACAKTGTTPPPSAAAAAHGPLSPEQQTQVTALVEQYLVDHPEAVEQAQATLEARRQMARYKKIIADGRNFSTGPANAKVHIVEFFDYRCVHCKDALTWSMDKVKNRKDVRFTFIEFPILTENSLEASQAAIASIKQGRYLPFHLAMMSSRGELASREIDAYAQQVGIDVARMRRDMKSPEILDLLQANHDVAAEAKIEGTPGFVINGKFFFGYDPEALDKALRDAGAAPSRT